MVRKLFYILIFFIFSLNSAIAAVDVVYPSTKNSVINSSNTFVFGNVQKGSQVLINNSPVKLWNDCFFVEIVNLNYGKNNVIFTEVRNGQKNDVIYTITRNKPIYKKAKNQETIIFPPDEIWYSRTVNDNSTVRKLPSSASSRAVELGKNIVLYLEAKKGDYYKIKTNSNSQYWIHKTNIIEPVLVEQAMNNVIKNQKYTTDKKYEYHKFELTYPVFYTVKQLDNSLKLVLFGVNSGNFEYTFNFDYPLLAYDCYYEDNKFVLKTAKNPVVSDTNIFKNVNIFVDAGHGGVEKGAIGPTRVPEKDINLAIANNLIYMLKKDGANVSFSRNDDSTVKLYERVNSAKENNALISVSIHNNSLSNGKSPYVQHGSEVHYYNENAKMLADFINVNICRDLNLKNNGIHKSSFALTRSTNPVSVLVEVAYMINPQEYIMLNNPDFQTQVAVSIKKGIKQYLEYISTHKYH